MQLDNARVEFEIISEEKRLREETEKAEAATKAKESEYADTKLAVDEAKVGKDRAQAEFDRLNKEWD